MNIAVIGTGYVGLVTGTCFAETGNSVICVDINKDKVESMKNGIIPIYEPGLEKLFEKNTKKGRLSFTTSLKDAVDHSDIIFLALPTPPGEDGSADLSYILGVANDLGDIIKSYKVIIDKSTVPVGTAERVHNVLASKLDTALFDVVSNPEFLREGVAVDDFMKPDRVVIGTSSKKAEEMMKLLYKPFVMQGNPIIFMDERSAEMTKYAANSYLATRITFMNEVANLCELVGADVDHVRKGMGSDGRIGKRFLFAGVGYGGSCFPKDVQALYKTASQHSYDFDILKSVMAVNDKQKTVLAHKAKRYFKSESLVGKKIAIWGLAFKPNTDDIREAPSRYIIDILLEAGASIHVHDPEAMSNIEKIYGNQLNYFEDQYDSLQECDLLLVVTEWSSYKMPDYDKMFSCLKERAIIDGRNIYDLDLMKNLNCYYESIGRQIILPNL